MIKSAFERCTWKLSLLCFCQCKYIVHIFSLLFVTWINQKPFTK